MQHLMVNTDVALDGDRATVRTMMVNPMGARTREGPPHFFYIGGRYDDDFVRTADGWKIAKRVETLLWFQGTLPPELLRVDPVQRARSKNATLSWNKPGRVVGARAAARCPCSRRAACSFLPSAGSRSSTCRGRRSGG